MTTHRHGSRMLGMHGHLRGDLASEASPNVHTLRGRCASKTNDIFKCCAPLQRHADECKSYGRLIRDLRVRCACLNLLREATCGAPDYLRAVVDILNGVPSLSTALAEGSHAPPATLEEDFARRETLLHMIHRLLEMEKPSEELHRVRHLCAVESRHMALRNAHQGSVRPSVLSPVSD